MLRVLAAAVCATMLACAPSPEGQAQPTAPASVTALSSTPSPVEDDEEASAGTTIVDPSVYLFAVGDIASCRTEGDEEVAAFLQQRRARIAVLGDAVYDSGSVEEYQECFDPAWGALRQRLRPTPGNHDYRTDGAAGYFAYFGSRAATPGKGWYAYNLGDSWRAIVLNANCASVGGCGPDSPQGRWLRRQLDRAGDRHILAYWHQPRFSSGRHGSDPSVAPLWDALYAGRADIVLNGHDHTYERFAPQTPGGERRRRGIRQFIVGSGGYEHYPFEGPPLETTQVRNDDTFGVLRLRLDPNGYAWRFFPVDGEFTDRGRHTF